MIEIERKQRMDVAVPISSGMVGLYNANDVPAQRRQTHKHKPGSCDGKVNINVGASEHDEW